MRSRTRRVDKTTCAPSQVVVVSDLHLWQSIEPDGLWMRYRQRDLFPDETLSALFEKLRAVSRCGELEVVFAGDIFDFDVPVVRDGRLDPSIEPTDAPTAAWVLDAIVDDHPGFVDAVARLLSDGHWVTFLAGNHDLQLAFPEVRAVLSRRLEKALRALGAPVDLEASLSRLRFRSWFHLTTNGIVIEHGSQYDRCCSVAYPMEPVLDVGGTLEPTMGSLAMRELIARLGYFNPNVDDSFLLTARGYFRHWLRYYAFRSQSLVWTWLVGSVRIAFGLVRKRERDDSKRALLDCLRAAAETATELAVVREHRELRARSSIGQAARILGLDGVGLSFGLAIAAATCTLGRAPWLGLLIALISGAAALTLRIREHDRGLEGGYARVRAAQRRIGELYRAKAVVVGHTHVAEGEWDDNGVFRGNAGTWSPTYADVACTRPIHHGRTFVWLRGVECLEGGLYRFIDGRIEPAFVRAAPRRNAAA